ncbi:hypothetical protein [Azospirillum sp. sgz302134]
MAGKGFLMGALLAAGLTAGGAGSALAQSCADLVERFAADHSLSTTPPPTAAPSGTAGSTAQNGAATGSGSGAASSERLAQSGGVVAPPAVGDTAVIEPPRAGSSNMPTAPAVRPDSGPGSGSTTGGTTGGSPGDTMGQAAQNAQLESLVTAARSAAKRGDEAQCMESLSQARRLGQAAPGGTGGGG